MAKKSWVVPVLVVLVLGMLAVAIYGIYSLKPVANTELGPQANTDGSGSTYISTGATALSIVGADSLNAGTSVTPTSQIQINGNGFSAAGAVTTASPQQTLDILLNASGYHTLYLPGQIVPASPTMVIPAKMLGNASITLTMFNTNNQVLTNAAAGGAVNQSVIAGGAYTMPLRFDGQDKKATGPMRCVLETTSGQNTSNIVFSGDLNPTLVGQAKPNFYTLSGVGSAVYVYDVDGISGAVSKNTAVQISSNTGKTLAGNNLKVTCYPKEYFIEPTTGKVVQGIEDSTGTAKNIAAYSYTIMFQ